MGKKFWLWLWIIALALLMFFCVKTKIAKMAPEIEPAKVVKEEAVVQTPKVVKKEIVMQTPKVVETPKDIELKIDKDGDTYSVSGLLNNKNSLINLASKYQDIKDSRVKFDKKHSNEKVMTMFMNLDGVLSRFKTGYMEYRDGLLTVDGVVTSQEDKDIVDKTLSSISDVKVDSHIVVETPKPAVEHIGKLSITKEGDSVKVSGIFSSQEEIDSLIKLLSDKGLDAKKELCVVDDGLKEDRWKEPFVVVLDDFTQFTKGTIQFDKDSFSIVGETQQDGIKGDVEHRLSLVDDKSVILSSDITYTKPKPTKEQVQDEINSMLKLKSIRFKISTAELIDESKTILDEVANILLKHPDIKVSIEGHTDSSGDANKNLILSQNRADSVREYLVGKGVKSDNLKAIGYGEEKPLVKNNSKENKQINRRVEFIIIGE